MLGSVWRNNWIKRDCDKKKSDEKNVSITCFVSKNDIIQPSLSVPLYVSSFRLLRFSFFCGIITNGRSVLFSSAFNLQFAFFIVLHSHKINNLTILLTIWSFCSFVLLFLDTLILLNIVFFLCSQFSVFFSSLFLSALNKKHNILFLSAVWTCHDIQ